MAKRDRANKKLTERIYKVPCCVQDTIPISRISENGIFGPMSILWTKKVER